MVVESDGHQTALPWGELVRVVNALSQKDRELVRKIFRAFGHDLRQACGQIQSAERLLRRLPAGPETRAEDWLELLSVIEAANTAANGLLASMAVDFIEHIDG